MKYQTILNVYPTCQKVQTYKQTKQNKANKMASSVISMETTSPTGIAGSVVNYTKSVIGKLADKYDFDLDEATEFADVANVVVVVNAEDNATTTKKKGPVKQKVLAAPLFPLPWCGVVMDEWCKAIKKNRPPNQRLGWTFVPLA